MTNIPQTRRQFVQMDFLSQLKVKQKLLHDNLDRMCEAVNPESMNEFSRVLHKNDLEKLNKKKERDCRSNVIMDLLMAIPRSMKKNPSWWEVLERVLQADENWEMYNVMNPWKDRDMRGGAAGGGGGGHGGGGGGGRGGGDEEAGGHGRSVPSSPMTAIPVDAGGFPRIQIPYSGSTPLAQTNGIHRLLIPLCAEGDDRLWRDLADGLGLISGDQLEIMGIMKKQQNDLHRLLMDKFIQRYEDAATVHWLISALQKLGEPGQRVVREMEQRKLIHPVQTAGSEADGEVVGGAMYDDERGGASARSYQAPTPRVPSCNATPLFSPSADGCHTNLSCGQPSKADPQPDLSAFTEKREASVQRPVSSADEEALKHPQPHIASSPSGRQVGLDRHRSSSTDSIVDNSWQLHTARSTDGTLAPEEKILNCPPVSSPADAGVTEDKSTKSQKEAQRSSSVEVDAPSSPYVREEIYDTIPGWLRSSQQEIEDQLRAASSEDTAPTAPQTPTSSAVPPQHVHINVNINNIKRAENVVIGLENKIEDNEDRMERNEGHVHEPNTSTEDFTANSDYGPSTEQESGEGGNYNEENAEGCTLASYRPDLEDVQAYDTHHRTRLKLLFDGHDEGEHAPVCEEPLEREDDFDILHIRPENNTSACFAEDTQMRSTDSLPRDTSMALCHGETEEDNNNSAGSDPLPSTPQQHNDLVSEQPPLPPPQTTGVMTMLSRAWGTVRDALLDME